MRMFTVTTYESEENVPLDEIYTYIVEVIYGEDVRNVSQRVHSIATGAECYCEDPYEDSYTSDDDMFSVFPAD